MLLVLVVVLVLEIPAKSRRRTRTRTKTNRSQVFFTKALGFLEVIRGQSLVAGEEGFRTSLKIGLAYARTCCGLSSMALEKSEIAPSKLPLTRFAKPRLLKAVASFGLSSMALV